MQPDRILHLPAGIAMIVTDLHGEYTTYEQLRDHFLNLHNNHQADYFILCGDLIHGYGDASEDGSLAMLLDLMRLQRELGAQTVIMLLGNHEFAHIYNVILSKGTMEYTSRFEHALTRATDEAGYQQALNFLIDLPFYVCTQAGVMISHAGASPHITTAQQAHDLATFDHRALHHLADDTLTQRYDLQALRDNAEYRQQVARFFAIKDPQHPRFHHYLRGQLIAQTMPEFNMLWDTFFNQNENEYGQNKHQLIITQFLIAISSISPNPQNTLVMGHMPVHNGYKIVTDQLLRLATYTHAQPRATGQYLLLDCAQPVQTSHDLIPSLHPISAIKNAP